MDDGLLLLALLVKRQVFSRSAQYIPSKIVVIGWMSFKDLIRLLKDQQEVTGEFGMVGRKTKSLKLFDSVVVLVS